MLAANNKGPVVASIEDSKSLEAKKKKAKDPSCINQHFKIHHYDGSVLK